MLNYEYPDGMSVGRLMLELSLKPFRNLDEASIEKVCEELFSQWRPVSQYASSLAVMLWTSDGSEILEYAGELDEEFDWCRYLGIGNPQGDENKVPCEFVEALPPSEPGGFDLHVRPVLYMKNPPRMTYRGLMRIVAALKRVGGRMYGVPVEVGETFDPGPEFARSDFKYGRHAEIAQGSIMVEADEAAKTKKVKLWLHCAARLNGDTRRYAAYPDGIPEGLHFGRFLGEQFMALKRDLGFDFIWLSNGFGYSLESWNWTGELFDGERFDSAHTLQIREKIAEFWREFSAAVGDTRVETRGSNLSTGMDIAAHGSPIDEIYRQNVVAPPNSPWAALNFRFGLELAGFMSHIASLPARGFQVRYYTHDPWWHNSPWFDRYDRMPHDIYLPLSIARMDENGWVTKPLGLSLLSADDSYGRLPRRCPIEASPHILDGFHHYPDVPGPLTWVYPFEGYARMGLRENHMERMFMDDWLIESAIDEGLPLNTVVSDEIFAACALSAYRDTVLVMPVPQAGAEGALLRALDAGLHVLLYGSHAFASEEVKSLIGVTDASPLSGEVRLSATHSRDAARYGAFPDMLLHDALLSDGPLSAIFASGAGVRLLSSVAGPGGEERAYMTFNDRARGGKLGWLRGSFPHARTTESLPHQLDRERYVRVGALMRALLSEFGVDVSYETETPASDRPVLFLSRSGGAIWLSGYAKDTTAVTKLKLPGGAPICTGCECVVDDGGARYVLPKWWRMECRVLVDQREHGVVGVQHMTAEHPRLTYRLRVYGLKNASVRFLPPDGVRVYFTQNDAALTAKANVSHTVCGNMLVTEPITGELFISWGEPRT